MFTGTKELERQITEDLNNLRKQITKDLKETQLETQLSRYKYNTETLRTRFESSRPHSPNAPRGPEKPIEVVAEPERTKEQKSLFYRFLCCSGEKVESSNRLSIVKPK